MRDSGGTLSEQETRRHIRSAASRPPSLPYRSSPVFTQDSLPKALQQEHRTKRGVWAVINILEGQLRYCRMDGGPAVLLSPACPGLVRPDQPHFVELIGPVSVRIDFFDHPPVGEGPWTC
ncbi:DUF1971 domain-containing protein [Sphingomonas sp. H39-1-10]|uniref:DUF1971 domain-containing protein n=1 Tax=Sphingomonas TaxID=13687 RepID=UPI00087FA320|nr:MULTISPECIES: DUF1971 domain-containing protein [Sphingomonas]MDF0489946.1 DUF1971 domain-containing protein [Sphingomonas pollutisoli]SDA36935.1 Uncharacterized protein, possibly involved in tellurite resistance [Sphingomonas sp. NFR15]